MTENERTELKEIILKSIEKHPLSQPRDLLKLLFQNEFGGGHLIKDEKEAFARLKDEYASLEPERNDTFFEYIGNNKARANISAFTSEEMPILCKAFTESAKAANGSKEALFKKLDYLTELAKMQEIPYCESEIAQAVYSYKNGGDLLISHSERYREAYKPAYRVINKPYANALLAAKLALQISKGREYTVIAVDGMAGAGKTTAAEAIGTLLDANIIHADDFFLPPEMRSGERLAQPGGNIHYERLKAQVIDNLRQPEAFTYEVFDCGKGRISETRAVENKPFTVIEGSYSLHPALGDYADLRIFVKTDPETQLRRIKARNGEAAAEIFKAKWIPLENRYFDYYGIDESVLLSIST